MSGNCFTRGGLSLTPDHGGRRRNEAYRRDSLRRCALRFVINTDAILLVLGDDFLVKVLTRA